MIRLTLLAISFLSACAVAHADDETAKDPAISDEALLKYVRERRSALEQFTPKAQTMMAGLASRCSLPPQSILSEDNPHQALELTFGSSEAALSYFDPLGKFPEHSVLLKEKIGEKDGKTELFTGMLKREKGYFPEGGDWEYFVADAAAEKIQARGKIQKCASCHEDYSYGDFVTRFNSRGPVQISGGRIILHGSTATNHGDKLVYESSEKKNTLGFWTQASDWASWKFEIRQPGVFEVHLWQGCGPDSGGSEVEVGCADQHLRFTVEETGGFQNFTERVIGKIEIREKGEQTLEVRALSKPGLAVMDLQRVVLIPVQP